ncbi:MAG: hypothetical protein GX556_19735 [Fibrobacter sp.]|nr:hypothetical protein [Fibrobacter sp.]
MKNDYSLNLSLSRDNEAQKNPSTENLSNKPESRNHVDSLVSISVIENPSRAVKCFKERFSL